MNQILKRIMLISLVAGVSGLINQCKKNVEVVPPTALSPVPTEKQLHWQKDEMMLFVHFGIKTFYPSDNHMGDGTEDPKRFNPVKFDANQWVEAAKAGGFKGIVMTSKHHDGFCNWPTKTTDHSVASSDWKNGEGDVVRELAEACRKGGIRFGLYSSIYDQHYEKSGKNKAAYSDYYLAQLEELLTNYGKIDELWFDGFGSENMTVDFKKVSDLLKRHQPGAIIYDSGTLVEHMPDDCVSWPGAHGGVKDPSWSFLDEGGPWYPPEASLIIQGNWFYHGEPMISQERLQSLYLNTVGLNAVALMNVAPNQNGLIDEATIEGLSEFKDWVDKIHGNDLAREENTRITASTHRGGDELFAPEKMVDGDYDTFFTTDDGETKALIEFDLGDKKKIKGFILQEYIPLGQRVAKFRIQVKPDNDWVDITSQSTIGYKRIIMGQTNETGHKAIPESRYVRILIEEARACPLINTIQIIGENK